MAQSAAEGEPGISVVDSRPYLSIVIPALNEARRLPSTLRRLHTYLIAQDYSWEIIVVSNGSTDGTVAAARGADVENLSVVELSDRGKGIATKAGVRASRGDALFLCDADLSMPPERIAMFLAGLDAVDIVVGSREAPGAQRFNEPVYRHVMGRVFNRIVKLLAVPRIEDTQCGFKAFRRSVALDLFPRQAARGFGADVEVLYLARRLGYTMCELPIDWYFDVDTRVRPGVDSLAMVGEVIAIRWRDFLGRYNLKVTRSTRGE